MKIATFSWIVENNRMQTAAVASTFAVHDVPPATPALDSCPAHEAVQVLLGTRVEALADYTERYLAGVRGHPLIETLQRAWDHHYPVVLSPDAIWIAILQGLAQHVKNHAESLRSRFVSFAGCRTLSVTHPDLVAGSPENPWPEVVAAFAQFVHDEIGPERSWLRADFSTSGPREQVVADIALLDALQPFYEYRAFAACGIPAVTLEGTPDDWQHLADKVERLAEFDLDWWLRHLRPIARQFVRAAQGEVDLDHWRNLYKRLDLYGGHVINGWMVKLIPYLRDGTSGLYTQRNGLLEVPWEPYPATPAVPKPDSVRRRFSVDEPAVTPRSLPLGISAVPFTQVLLDKREQALEFLAGFLGVAQDADTLALRPVLGWAVRSGGALARLLNQLRRCGAQAIANPLERSAALRAWGERERLRELPGDFLAIYRAFDGVEYRDTSGGWIWRLLPLEEVRRVEPRYPLDHQSKDVTRNAVGEKVPVFDWVRVIDLADGSYLALDFRYQMAEPEEGLDRANAWRTAREREYWQVIHCREDEADPRRAYRVVAWCLGEFLRRALAGGASHYWEQADFSPRGDAFTVARYAGAFPLDRVREARAPSPLKDPAA